MPEHIDHNDPRYAQAAAEILRHDNAEPEANTTNAVRDFLIVTRLVRADEIVEEDPPAQGSHMTPAALELWAVAGGGTDGPRGTRP